MTAQPFPEPKFMSRADYARRSGWPASYVTKLAKRGIVVLVWAQGKVWVDVAQSDWNYEHTIRPRFRLSKFGHVTARR